MRKILSGVAVLSFTIMLAPQAVAQKGTLHGLSGAGSVIVWKSKKAHQEGMTLMNAGIHGPTQLLLFPLVACIVPSWTSTVIVDGGFATHDVMVTSGEHTGCRGNIPVEAFRQ